jgi:hypothetical protein
MDSIIEILKVVASLTGNPLALLGLFALSALALAAWAIYALIVTVQQNGKD